MKLIINLVGSEYHYKYSYNMNEMDTDSGITLLESNHTYIESMGDEGEKVY